MHRAGDRLSTSAGAALLAELFEALALSAGEGVEALGHDLVEEGVHLLVLARWRLVTDPQTSNHGPSAGGGSRL